MQRYKLVELVSFPQETNAFEQFLYVQLRQGWRYLNYTPLGVVFENMALDSFTEKKKLSIEDIQKKLDIAIDALGTIISLPDTNAGYWKLLALRALNEIKKEDKNEMD